MKQLEGSPEEARVWWRQSQGDVLGSQRPGPSWPVCQQAHTVELPGINCTSKHILSMLCLTRHLYKHSRARNSLAAFPSQTSLGGSACNLFCSRERSPTSVPWLSDWSFISYSWVDPSHIVSVMRDIRLLFNFFNSDH